MDREIGKNVTKTKKIKCKTNVTSNFKRSSTTFFLVKMFTTTPNEEKKKRGNSYFHTNYYNMEYCLAFMH